MQFTVLVIIALQNALICTVFAFGLFAGGVASAANATNVQDDYDNRACDEIRNSYSDDHRAVEICENVEQLIYSQFFCAVSMAKLSKYIKSPYFSSSLYYGSQLFRILYSKRHWQIW